MLVKLRSCLPSPIFISSSVSSRENLSLPSGSISPTCRSSPWKSNHPWTTCLFLWPMVTSLCLLSSQDTRLTLTAASSSSLLTLFLNSLWVMKREERLHTRRQVLSIILHLQATIMVTPHTWSRWPLLTGGLVTGNSGQDPCVVTILGSGHTRAGASGAGVRERERYYRVIMIIAVWLPQLVSTRHIMKILTLTSKKLWKVLFKYQISTLSRSNACRKVESLNWWRQLNCSDLSFQSIISPN